MSESREATPRVEEVPDPRLPQVHETMAKEADGFYGLTSTICSAFVGGTIMFSKEFLAQSPPWARLVLIGGVVGLTLCLALLCWVRWGNVESYRRYAVVLRTGRLAEYDALVRRASCERLKTRIALWALSAGLGCLAIFATERVWNFQE